MTKKISFIGAGNMGGAVARCIAQILPPEQITLATLHPEKARRLADELGCKWVTTNEEAVQTADIIFLCVKPQMMRSVLAPLAAPLNERCARGEAPLLVSIAAGLTIESLRSFLDGDCAKLPMARLMPNTPLLIGKGMSALCFDGGDVAANTALLTELLTHSGRCELLSEHLFDQFSAAAGCTTGFAFTMIEAMADAGVLIGLPRAQALTYAAQVLYGAAAMVLETGGHPAPLRDAVCSPGGSTIAGVAAMEEAGFRHAVIEGVRASFVKTKDLGK